MAGYGGHRGPRRLHRRATAAPSAAPWHWCRLAETLSPMVSPSPIGSTVSWPPRGIAWPAISSIFSRSLTRFLPISTRGRFQASLVLSSSRKPREIFSASPVSICEPADPAAPKAMRQNCSLAEAVLALFLISSSANCLGFLVLFLGQHFQSVDDGADRADQVVAHPRAQQGGEIERFDGGSGHGLASAGRARFNETGESLVVATFGRDTPHHRERQGKDQG